MYWNPNGQFQIRDSSRQSGHHDLELDLGGPGADNSEAVFDDLDYLGVTASGPEPVSGAGNTEFGFSLDDAEFIALEQPAGGGAGGGFVEDANH